MDFDLTTRWMIAPDLKVVNDAIVVVEDGIIQYAGSRNTSPPPAAGREKIDFPKGLLAPAFINGHTHIGETLVRGLCDDLPLKEWLYDNIWRVEPRLREGDCFWGALLGCGEMIAGGTIGFCDQYFFADDVARAVNRAGLKAYLFPSIFEPTPEAKTMEDAFQAAIRVHNAWNGRDNRIFVGFGPHSPYSVSGDWLQKIAQAARDRQTGLHIHLSETRQEIADARKNWGRTPIEYCEHLGILNEKTIAAHCVHLQPRDFQILKEKNVTVAHCPQSNMKLASGIAPVPQLNAMGINVCVGTDGQASNNNLDMLEELVTAALVHKVNSGDPTTLNAASVLRLGTAHPAKLFGKFASGKIEKGATADLAVFNLAGPRNVPVINALSNLLYATSSSDCVFTACNGRILYQEGEFKTINIEEVLAKAQEITNRLVQEAGIQHG